MTSNKSYRVKCGTNRDSHLYQWALPAVPVTVAELHCEMTVHWTVPADSVTVVALHRDSRTTPSQSSLTLDVACCHCHSGGTTLWQ